MNKNNYFNECIFSLLFFSDSTVDRLDDAKVYPKFT